MIRTAALLLVLAACGDPRVLEVQVDAPEDRAPALERSLAAWSRGHRCRILVRASGDPGTPILVATCAGDPGALPDLPGARSIAYRERRAAPPVAGARLVGRNYYDVPAANLRAAERVRLRASVLREALGVRPGRVLAREGAGEGPELVWEQELAGIDRGLQEREARAGADPRFQAIVAEMRGLMGGFAQALYRVAP